MVLPHLGAPASSLDRPVQFLPITALIKPGQHTPAEILALGLELRIPNAAAQTRPVSLAGIRPDSRGSKRYFKQIFCDNISEFEANMPSHAVGSLPARVHQPMTQPLPLVRIASRVKIGPREHPSVLTPMRGHVPRQRCGRVDLASVQTRCKGNFRWLRGRVGPIDDGRELKRRLQSLVILGLPAQGDGSEQAPAHGSPAAVSMSTKAVAPPRSSHS
jgi:hypothetical protein